MEIKSLNIENWQSIEFLTIKFDKLLILIGGANRGKSSVIQALKAILLNREIVERDFKIKDKRIVLQLKCFSNDIGFFKVRLIKESDFNERYFFIREKVEREISFKEFKELIKGLEIKNLISKNIDITSSLEQLKSSMKNRGFSDNLVEDLESKLKFLRDGKVAPSLERRIFFRFLKSFAKEIDMKRIDSLNSGGILIFEEPELYLSPQGCRELYSILVKLSSLGIQIILKTYSSYFVGLNQYRSICLMRKIDGKIKAFQYSGKLFRGDEVKNFNMNYWINPDRGELFFAKKVILVEGQTDKIAISYLAKRLKMYKYNYSIIECGSKSTIPQFIRVLNAFKIPYIAVYDKDNHHWRNEKELENSNLKNQEIQRSINKNIGEYLEFENDIEEEIYNEKRDRKNYKNKPYYALNTISSKEYIVPKRLYRKIERIYR